MILGHIKTLERQRGITLLIGLIMLVMITLMVTTAFTLSNTNLKSVGNMQARDEALAAANIAIEQMLGSAFTNAPAAETINVDINNDSVVDYVVTIATPVCIRASQDRAAPPSSASLPGLTLAATWNTLWDIQATVNDARSGASVSVKAGTRVLLSESEKQAVCS